MYIYMAYIATFTVSDRIQINQSIYMAYKSITEEHV